MTIAPVKVAVAIHKNARALLAGAASNCPFSCFTLEEEATATALYIPHDHVNRQRKQSDLGRVGRRRKRSGKVDGFLHRKCHLAGTCHNHLARLADSPGSSACAETRRAARRIEEAAAPGVRVFPLPRALCVRHSYYAMRKTLPITVIRRFKREISTVGGAVPSKNPATKRTEHRTKSGALSISSPAGCPAKT